MNARLVLSPLLSAVIVLSAIGSLALFRAARTSTTQTAIAPTPSVVDEVPRVNQRDDSRRHVKAPLARGPLDGYDDRLLLLLLTMRGEHAKSLGSSR